MCQKTGRGGGGKNSVPFDAILNQASKGCPQNRGPIDRDFMMPQTGLIENKILALQQLVRAAGSWKNVIGSSADWPVLAG